MPSPKIFFQRLDGADFVNELATASFNYNEGIISVAFARKNGADIICNNVLNNKKIIFFIGINNGVTSKQALEYLLDKNVHQDIYLVNTGTPQQIFHPKVFCFYEEASKEGVLSVGSSNLTSGGFETNIEANILLYINHSNWDLIQTIMMNLNIIKADCIHLKSKHQLDNLLNNGFLEDESKKIFVPVRNHIVWSPSSPNIPKVKLKTIVKSQKEPTSTGTVSPTSTGTVSPTSTGTVSPASTGTVSPTSTGTVSPGIQTIWFETKRMTGGSRNILDLSMKSLVERGDPKGTIFEFNDSKLMLGTVYFFGVDPLSSHKRKLITLEFDGVDYIGNEILFPTGDNANGTWRLQIKGVSSNNIKITDAFRAKEEGYYLVEKIITFTKIREDYYSLSVYSESEMANFKLSSRILGRNGSSKNAKQFGLF
ncbi:MULTISPECIES: phospholipase D family protein [unclassified Acinetobacter]|uniref:phospholipase D family protein n=2 Tax=Acinetobacter TaxID=469 RepID=UPI0015D3961D|nr:MULTISPECIES: phospholipase D family protein [unclassified Acinetobacter]